MFKGENFFETQCSFVRKYKQVSVLWLISLNNSRLQHNPYPNPNLSPKALIWSVKFMTVDDNDCNVIGMGIADIHCCQKLS